MLSFSLVGATNLSNTNRTLSPRRDRVFSVFVILEIFPLIPNGFSFTKSALNARNGRASFHLLAVSEETTPPQYYPVDVLIQLRYEDCSRTRAVR
jgi:hypothetical protein